MKQKETELVLTNIKKSAAAEVTKRRADLKKLIAKMKQKQNFLKYYMNLLLEKQ